MLGEGMKDERHPLWTSSRTLKRPDLMDLLGSR
jgi:hypothetical protein